MIFVDLKYRNDKFFDNYEIRRRNVDFSKDELFEKEFINRTINQRFKPLIYNGVVYDSLSSLYDSKIITRSKYNYLRRKSKKSNSKIIHNGHEIKHISLYEYVNY